MNDELPAKLLRFTDKEEYALAFARDGRIRLSNQRNFTDSTVDPRSDSTEGQGRLLIPNQILNSVPTTGGIPVGVRGTLDAGFVNGNPTFLFCTSVPQVDINRMKEKMGAFIVEIYNPKLFCDALEESVRSLGPKILLFEYHHCRVQYDKGVATAAALDPAKQEHLAFSQKPLGYSEECEYRFAALFNLEKETDALTHIELQLKEPATYARILSEGSIA
jgi:hypothetical protein